MLGHLRAFQIDGICVGQALTPWRFSNLGLCPNQTDSQDELR